MRLSSDKLSSLYFLKFSVFFLRHYEMQSQSHRMVWVERSSGLKSIQFQPLCHGQGCPSLDEFAQGPIQSGLEHLQGWDIQSGNQILFFPIPVASAIWRSKMASMLFLANEMKRINLHCRHNSVTQEQCKMCDPTLRQVL